MDIANNEAKSVEGEEDRTKSQSSDGGACAEDRQGLPTDAGADVVAAPAANPEKAKRPRAKKVVMERTVSTPQTVDIGSDPSFILREAQRHVQAS